MLAFQTLSARAIADDEGDLEQAVEVHGFVSQGFVKTVHHNYLVQRSQRGSFEFTEAGLNFTAPLSDRLTAGIQLFARDLGPLGNYRPQFDWYYLDYHAEDWFGIRAGRTKIPYGLYNESSDIDAARVPILLPQSIYPVQDRDYLLAQTGGELYGNVRLGGAGEAEYRAYGGTIHIDTTDSSDTIKRISVPYVAGGRLMWLLPTPGLQIGGSFQALRLELDYQPPPELLDQYKAAGLVAQDFTGPIPAAITAKLWVASLEYSFEDLSFATEYGRWLVSLESDLPQVVPPSDTTSERFYAMASYRVAPWFTPGIYYSVLYPDTAERVGRAAQQHDLALTFRYDIGPHWLLKLEGHYMHGTASLSSSENHGLPRQQLAADWGVLLAKTTAYF